MFPQWQFHGEGTGKRGQGCANMSFGATPPALSLQGHSFYKQQRVLGSHMKLIKGL